MLPILQIPKTHPLFLFKNQLCKFCLFSLQPESLEQEATVPLQGGRSWQANPWSSSTTESWSSIHPWVGSRRCTFCSALLLPGFVSTEKPLNLFLFLFTRNFSSSQSFLVCNFSLLNSFLLSYWVCLRMEIWPNILQPPVFIHLCIILQETTFFFIHPSPDPLVSHFGTTFKWQLCASSNFWE